MAHTIMHAANVDICREEVKREEVARTIMHANLAGQKQSGAHNDTRSGWTRARPGMIYSRTEAHTGCSVAGQKHTPGSGDPGRQMVVIGISSAPEQDWHLGRIGT